MTDLRMPWGTTPESFHSLARVLAGQPTLILFTACSEAGFCVRNASRVAHLHLCILDAISRTGAKHLVPLRVSKREISSTSLDRDGRRSS